MLFVLFFVTAVLSYKMCSSDNSICVYPYINGSNINVNITANGKGWSAFGINSVNDFPNADIWWIWTNSDGSISIVDGYIASDGSYHVDTASQDVSISSFSITKQIIPATSTSNSTIQSMFNIQLVRNSSVINPGEDIIVQDLLPVYWILMFSNNPSSNPKITVGPLLQGKIQSVTESISAFAPTWKFVSSFPYPFSEVGTSVEFVPIGYSHMDDDIALQNPFGTYATYINIHACLMFLVFGIVIPWAMFVARFQKISLSGGKWITIHKVLVGLSVFCLSLSVYSSVSVTPSSRFIPHAGFGIFILVHFIGIQIPLGIAAFNKSHSSDSDPNESTDLDRILTESAPTSQSIVNKYHHFSGYCLLFLSVIQITLGFYSFDETPSFVLLGWFLFVPWLLILMIAVRYLQGNGIKNVELKMIGLGGGTSNDHTPNNYSQQFLQTAKTNRIDRNLGPSSEFDELDLS